MSTDKRKVIQAYLSGQIKDEASLKVYLEQEKLKEDILGAVRNEVEPLKQKLDTTEIDIKLDGLKEKINEDIEIELQII